MRTPDSRPGGAIDPDDECLAGWPRPQPIADIVREALDAKLHPAWRALRLTDEPPREVRLLAAEEAGDRRGIRHCRSGSREPRC